MLRYTCFQRRKQRLYTNIKVPSMCLRELSVVTLRPGRSFRIVAQKIDLHYSIQCLSYLPSMVLPASEPKILKVGQVGKAKKQVTVRTFFVSRG